MNRKTRKIRGIGQQIEELSYTADTVISDKLADNEAEIVAIFDKCSDLVVRKMELPGSVPCLVVYLNVLVEDVSWDGGLLEPLSSFKADPSAGPDAYIDQLTAKLASTLQPMILGSMKEVVESIVHGSVVLFLESQKRAVLFPFKDQKQRELQEPSTEAVIRGPRLGFIENIDVNMALLRQYLRTPRLKMERMSVGKLSRTDVTLAYLDSYAPPSVIQDVKTRLSQIQFDSVISSGYVEELISDHPYSPFPVIQATERPDSVAASFITGKVAVIVNGTPMVLLLPVTFWFGFQSAEDYFMNFIFATMLRWLRYLFAFMAMALPSIFVAITTYHPEMIPTSLALSLAAAREVVPFPAMAETLIMEITFEALREAGVRLPRPVGQTISIVGALVIGQAAVQAGIISAPIIIVVSMTGIASFLIPHAAMSQAVSMMRFPMVVLAGTFGLYGVSAGLLAILVHLTTLRSYGVPYLWPIAPFNRPGMMDVIVRSPWRYMHKRQQHIQQMLELQKQ
ncbi:spore germination protein [Cohnella sp. CFH 77786]|uniref:spore germination protein n=1 Tax=Cohnella sp. CFH 77786 TaxID=2662265 RepID=UPI001C60884F|nr:spore germination protein [Cohnella sp. CFH 77786]MBW5445670.1 spore germination protein [Cohnella sp. CFH 77786]